MNMLKMVQKVNLGDYGDDGLDRYPRIFIIGIMAHNKRKTANRKDFRLGSSKVLI